MVTSAAERRADAHLNHAFIVVGDAENLTVQTVRMVAAGHIVRNETVARLEQLYTEAVPRTL